MSLHTTPEKHEADPPQAWLVVKMGDRWALDSSLGGTFDTFTTRKAAEQAKVSGFYVELYEKEGRWFAGEKVANWRPYADIAAERERLFGRS